MSSDRDTAEEALLQWVNTHRAELEQRTFQNVEAILHRAGVVGPNTTSAEEHIQTSTQGGTDEDKEECQEDSQDQPYELMNTAATGTQEAQRELPREDIEEPPRSWMQETWAAADAARNREKPRAPQLPSAHRESNPQTAEKKKKPKNRKPTRKRIRRRPNRGDLYLTPTGRREKKMTRTPTSSSITAKDGKKPSTPWIK